jgi:hypothetical protein
VLLCIADKKHNIPKNNVHFIAHYKANMNIFNIFLILHTALFCRIKLHPVDVSQPSVE